MKFARVKPDLVDDRAASRRMWELLNADTGFRLHTDTTPAAIAMAQRNAIRDALRELGRAATVEQVSEAACLPVWSVRRRLEEMGVTL